MSIGQDAKMIIEQRKDLENKMKSAYLEAIHNLKTVNIKVEDNQINSNEFKAIIDGIDIYILKDKIIDNLKNTDKINFAAITYEKIKNTVNRMILEQLQL